MRVAVLKAAFDDDARVWYVESCDIDGLHVEGDTFEAFRRNVADRRRRPSAGRGSGRCPHRDHRPCFGPRTRRCVKDFGKSVRDRLSSVGCSFLRHGKGDHDIWITPQGKRIVVPVQIKIPTYSERHFERSGPVQGVLGARRGAAVADRASKRQIAIASARKFSSARASFSSSVTSSASSARASQR